MDDLSDLPLFSSMKAEAELPKAPLALIRGVDVQAPQGGQAMQSRVVPFPRWRNRPFVEKHAANFAAYDPVQAEKYLANQMRVQRETMERRGVAPDRVEAEVAALETAIRRNASLYEVAG